MTAAAACSWPVFCDRLRLLDSNPIPCAVAQETLDRRTFG